jgi:uncharacterized protein (TIGR03083 family)
VTEPETDTGTWIRAVRSSHDRLAGLLRPLSAAAVEGPSYAQDWSIADTASHLGSQAEIFGLFLDAGLAGEPAPGGDAYPPIWDRWNALAPSEQVRQSIDANEAFVARVEQITYAERDRFTLAVFGSQLDLAGVLATRLSEHALHSWDIAVALDPSATVAPDAVDLLVDGLPATAARGGRATAGVDPVNVITVAPARSFLLDVSDPVTLQPTAEPGGDPLALPAEALIRVVYGRLDPDHTPVGADDPRLATLRTVFPGF